MPMSEEMVEEGGEQSIDELFSLLARPVPARAPRSPRVLLVDEVDRADDEFEAFLLEVLRPPGHASPSRHGQGRAPPVVVLTSNRTRELHDALKRRCLYHWIVPPGLSPRGRDRPGPGCPTVPARLAEQVVRSRQLRAADDLAKPPGVAETLDWARALNHLGTAELDLATAAATLGALVKYREDGREGQARPRPDAASMTAGGRGPGGDEILLAFAARCGAAGVPVTQDRAAGFLDAVGAGPGGRARDWSAGRRPSAAAPTTSTGSTRSSRRSSTRDGLPRARQSRRSRPPSRSCPRRTPSARAASRTHGVDPRARRRDRGAPAPRRGLALGLGEAAARRDVRHAHPRPPLRRTARHQRWHRGQVDASRTLRSSLRQMGEPTRISWRRRAPETAPRGVVDGRVRFHERLRRLAAAPGPPPDRGAPGPGRRGRDLHRRHPAHPPDPRACGCATPNGPWWRPARPSPTGRAAPGWARRCGSSCDRWGQRGMARGAVVVVFSDGWERGDPALLAEQMQRLHRVAHRVVWVNPHRGKAGYEARPAGRAGGPAARRRLRRRPLAGDLRGADRR